MKPDKAPFRYAPWLTRDVASTAGVLYAVITAIVCVIVWRLSRAAGGAMGSDVVMFQQQAFKNTLTVAVLIATGGMVSNDLHGGFYRAYFSKPIPTWWYYLQRWIIGGVFVLLIPVLFGAGLMLVLRNGHGITPALLGTIALGYLLIGGTVFVLSVFTRRDWLLVFILVTSQRAMASLMTMNLPVSKALKTIWQALPPYHLIDPGAAPLTGRPLMHVLAYGLSLVALALVLLRFRPLGSGGRA